MPVDAPEQRLVFVRAALDNLRRPMGLVAAQALLDDRGLTVQEARVRLEAERIVLEEAIGKGRGGKPLPKVSAPAPAAMHEEPGAPNAQFEQLHPRGGHGMFIKKGESSPRVSAMQNRLGELGHPTVPDGNFGPHTEQQVKEFQQKYGLPATGHVDPTTLEFMRNPPALSYQQANAELRTAAAAAGQAVGPGSVGPAVTNLQQQLVQLGFDTGMDANATYGKGTEAAIRMIQKQNGYAPTGRADEQTLALIARLVTEQTAAQGANRLTGDSAATWGLRPGARPGVAGGHTASKGKNPRAKPRPAATPNRKLTVQHADDTSEEGVRVEESTAATVAALAGRFAAVIEGPPRPPGLRETDNTKFAACASCVFFGGPPSSSLGGCQHEGYAGYPVDRDDICDLWKTATPEGARNDRAYDADDDDITEAEHELSEVKSDAYPGLDRSPKENWVDKAGGLPRYIERIAKHVHYEHGKSIGTAIAIAVGTVRRWCHGGAVATSAKGGVSKTHGVSPKTKAQACKAVAEWEAKKKASKAKSAAEAAAIMEAAGFQYDPRALAEFELLQEAYRSDFKPFPPSLNYARRILAEVEGQYDDWDSWGDDGSAPQVDSQLEADLVVFAQTAAMEASAANPDLALAPFARTTAEGAHLLYVAGVPVAVMESATEMLVAEESARAYDLRLRRMNPKQLRSRAAHAVRHLKGGMHHVESAHAQADLDVATLVSSRFAGQGAKPLTLGVKHRRHLNLHAEESSPDSSAVEGESLQEGGLGGLRAKFEEELHPRDRKGEWTKKFGGHELAAIHRLTGEGPGGPKASKKTAHEEEAGALNVDQAIGGVLANFPGLKDWSVDKHGDAWHVKVVMGDGEHHFKVTDDAKVSEVNPDGSPKAAPEPEPEPKPSAAGAGGWHETGEHEKPYHMPDGAHFKTKTGAILKKHESGKFTSSKGHSMAGVHVEDVKTGEKKWIPAFVLKEPHPIVSQGGAAKPVVAKTSADTEAALGASIAAHHGGDELASFKGKTVVVTGKIPGYTRDDVHALVAKAGGSFEKSVTSGTDVLITGEKVGAAKTKAAAAKGVKVVNWNDVAHLLEGDMSPLVRRVMGVHAELAEATDGGKDVSLRARLRVLEGRMDADDRRAYLGLRPDRAAMVVPRREARLA